MGYGTVDSLIIFNNGLGPKKKKTGRGVFGMGRGGKGGGCVGRGFCLEGS